MVIALLFSRYKEHILSNCGEYVELIEQLFPFDDHNFSIICSFCRRRSILFHVLIVNNVVHYDHLSYTSMLISPLFQRVINQTIFVSEVRSGPVSQKWHIKGMLLLFDQIFRQVDPH